MKREDLQNVRSYKIRGAYNKIVSIPEKERINGVICASAGNHAQGVALACQLLDIHGIIYMPNTTPTQKIKKVKQFGKDKVEVKLVGDTFDDSFDAAMSEAEKEHRTFIHPFNDEKIIEGQGTVAIEIMEAAESNIDYLILPVGGGGLISGVGSYFKKISPHTKIIGVEPEGAPAMNVALKEGKVVKLSKIDSFVDGAAVKQVGDINLEICKEVIDEMILIPEGKVCSTILQLYNEEAIVAEPAGALSIAALDVLGDKIKGKNVVCVVSGGNNDITRTAEIRERSLLFEGLKHYFIIRFPQRSGALREFLNVLGPHDDIAYFEYTKKTNRSTGPAVVGIELSKKEDFPGLLKRMDDQGINYETLNDKPDLFEVLV